MAILWLEGAEGTESRIMENWFTGETVIPLDALDSCYATVGTANPVFKLLIAKKLWAWGNLSFGMDGIFALCHLSSRRYRHVDLDACLKGLEALLARNNLLGLLYSQSAYERLFVAAVDSPDIGAKLANSLMNVLDKAAEEHDQVLRLQVIALVHSLIEAVNRDEASILERVLAAGAELDELCRLVNRISAGSRMQGRVTHALRKLFVRGAADGKAENKILRFFTRLCAYGTDDDRERLEFYWSDWSSAAEDHSEGAGRSARQFLETVQQGV